MNSKKKIAVISLVAMMLITAVGYAAISDKLYVDGIANTASFDVKFSAPALTSGEYGKLSYELADQDAGLGKSDILKLTLDKAVFGETYTVTGSVYNCGQSAATFMPPEVYTKNPNLFVVTFTSDNDTQIIEPGYTGYYTITIAMNEKTTTEGYAIETDEIDCTLTFKQAV